MSINDKNSILNEGGFIASSKVIRRMLNPAAADVLATLIYKHKYWKSKGKLHTIGGLKYFFISQKDIENETSHGKSVVSSRVALLKEAGLIKTDFKGQGKPNLYHVDFDAIARYVAEHDKKHKDLKNSKENLKDEREKGLEVTESIMIGENQTSRSVKTKHLETLKSSATNNKSTNNKNTNNKNINSITNHMNVANYEEEFNPNEDSLVKLIELARASNDFERDKKELIEIYFCLRDMVPQFSKFEYSDTDLEMIDELLDYKIYPHVIAGKIIANAKRIVSGDMQSRFGNLFVGLDEINIGIEDKYHK